MLLTNELQTHLAKSNISPRWMIWIKAKNRETNAVEQLGIWNGFTDIQTEVDSDIRLYRGAGGLIGMEAINYSAGLEIASQSVSVTLNDPKIKELIRVYDSRFAQVDIHLAILDPDTEAFIGTALAFRGTIDEASISDDLTIRLNLVSAMRNGSRKLTGKQSDADQKLVDTTDRGREYASIGNAVKVFWGQKTSD